MRFPWCVAILIGLLASGSALASKSQRQIGINASATFFALYRETGMSGVITKLQSCYDGANSADAYLFCLGMDSQARRLDSGMSGKLNIPVLGYFDDEQFGDRLTLMARWYPDPYQRDAALEQLLEGVDEGTRIEVARIGKQ
jgi:hypothetical protein